MGKALDEVAPGGVVHLWEHRQALTTIERLEEENARLRAYAKYVANRMQSQAMTINSKLSPVAAASMLDDLDDAATLAKIEPREWK